jgi:hypothetical protein
MTRNGTLITAATLFGLLAATSFAVGWFWQGLF